MNPTTAKYITYTPTGSTSNSTWTPCRSGHTWTYAGLPVDLEGQQCDCGRMIYHSEVCQCCGQNVSKPVNNLYHEEH